MIKITTKIQNLYSSFKSNELIYYYVINLVYRKDGALQVVYLDKDSVVRVVRQKEFFENLIRYSDTGEFSIQEDVDMVQFKLMTES